MSSTVLGRYVPYQSFIHRMDSRAKLFAMICLMVTVFLKQVNWAMTFLVGGLFLVFIMVLLLLSHTKITTFLKSLRTLWFMAIFLLIIYILIPRTSDWIAFSIGTFNVYWDSILDAAKILVRLMSMIALMLVFSASTKPLEMSDAFEWYMSPLKYIGFPSHELAMILSIALRFIPTILEDVHRIMNAQASRGVDFKHGGVKAKVRSVISLIVPLFVSAFMRSEELADAMECRGYDPRGKRTKYRVAHFSWRDLVGILVAAAWLGLVIASSVTHFDLFAVFGLEVR